MHYRLEPADEYCHEVTASERFNESVYVSLFDASSALGGFVRVGNQPCEGYSETTVCLYLPDGRVAFAFGRPAIDGNHAFDAGGLRVEIVEPFRQVRVRFDGRLGLFDDPRVMTDPKVAFAACPWAPAVLDLVVHDVSPVAGGEPVADPGEKVEPGGMFRGHTEQHTRVSGHLEVDGWAAAVDGYGVRDHSWGQRSWQANPWYRWLTATFGPDFGVMASTVSPLTDGGPRRSNGSVFAAGRLHPISRVELDTTWDDDHYPVAMTARITSTAGEHELVGTVASEAPLRNRKRVGDGYIVSRIVESFTEWTCGDRRAFGLAEYLDVLVDGRPAGR